MDLDGSERYTVRFMDLKSKQYVFENITNVQMVEWTMDSKKLLYVSLNPVTKRGDKVWLHTLGTDVRTDTLLFEGMSVVMFDQPHTSVAQALTLGLVAYGRAGRGLLCLGFS